VVAALLIRKHKTLALPLSAKLIRQYEMSSHCASSSWLNNSP